MSNMEGYCSALHGRERRRFCLSPGRAVTSSPNQMPALEKLSWRPELNDDNDVAAPVRPRCAVAPGLGSALIGWRVVMPASGCGLIPAAWVFRVRSRHPAWGRPLQLPPGTPRSPLHDSPSHVLDSVGHHQQNESWGVIRYTINQRLIERN